MAANRGRQRQSTMRQKAAGMLSGAFPHLWGMIMLSRAARPPIRVYCGFMRCSRPARHGIGYYVTSRRVHITPFWQYGEIGLLGGFRRLAI